MAKQQKFLFLPVLEAGSSRPRCWQVSFLWGSSPWLAGGLLTESSRGLSSAYMFVLLPRLCCIICAGKLPISSHHSSSWVSPGARRWMHILYDGGFNKKSEVLCVYLGENEKIEVYHLYLTAFYLSISPLREENLFQKAFWQDFRWLSLTRTTWL